MVWPILISRSVTPGAFWAAADSAMAPLRSRLPNKRGNTPLPASGDLAARYCISAVAVAARAFQAATPPDKRAESRRAEITLFQWIGLHWPAPSQAIRWPEMSQQVMHRSRVSPGDAVG